MRAVGAEKELTTIARQAACIPLVGQKAFDTICLFLPFHFLGLSQLLSVCLSIVSLRDQDFLGEVQLFSQHHAQHQFTTVTPSQAGSAKGEGRESTLRSTHGPKRNSVRKRVPSYLSGSGLGLTGF